MKHILTILFIFISGQWIMATQPTGHQIKIQWTDHIDGDFSFEDCWSYPEGVYRNQFGQLSCDGFCPPEIYEMKDEYGRIRDEFLTVFYQLVDTTHQYHSILSEAYTYEWAGTDFIRAVRINEDSVICSTYNNAGTHSSLQLVITQNHVDASIVLTSIRHNGSDTFFCKDGTVKIDRISWQKGILKAIFDLTFDHQMSNKEFMWWKGLIYAKITNPE